MRERSARGFLDSQVAGLATSPSSLKLDLSPDVEEHQWTNFLSEVQGLLEGGKQFSLPKGKGVALSVLPDVLEEDALYLSATMPVARSVAQFVLQRVPNADPPAVIRESSAALGGPSGFFDLLERSWPGERRETASVAATFDLPLVPPGLERLFPPVGSERLESESLQAERAFDVRAWRIKNSDLSEIHFIRSGDRVRIWLAGAVQVEVGARMFDQAGGRLWEAMQSLALMKTPG